jgi:hypothetical protein
MRERIQKMTGRRRSAMIKAVGEVREANERDPGPRELPLAGRDVSAVAVSRFVPFLRLQFWGGGVPDLKPAPDCTLEIEGPFRIVTAEREWSVVPQKGPDAAYLLLVSKTVARAVASDDGGLEVEFTDGDRLVVPPHEYEPWQLNGDDDSLVVSAAGGGLAVWDAKAPSLPLYSSSAPDLAERVDEELRAFGKP